MSICVEFCPLVKNAPPPPPPPPPTVTVKSQFHKKYATTGRKEKSLQYQMFHKGGIEYKTSLYVRSTEEFIQNFTLII